MKSMQPTNFEELCKSFKLTQAHIGCSEPRPSFLETIPLTDSTRLELMVLINDERRRVHATQMRMVHYDMYLEALAVKMTSHCITSTTDGDLYTTVSDPDLQEIPIFTFKVRDFDLPIEDNFLKMIRHGAENYVYERNRNTKYRMYLQIIYQGTARIGCSAAICQNARVYACAIYSFVHYQKYNPPYYPREESDDPCTNCYTFENSYIGVSCECWEKLCNCNRPGDS
ncbi:hypothetical protein SNEBB_004114 [Seison nebaliae]|nr:hypothetical protein SNEBB_004114 [Seison nebaliae]